MFCPQCGGEVTSDQVFCHHCGARIREEGKNVPETGHEAEAQAEAGRRKTPWEDREAVGFFNGLFRTMREVLFRPTAFFRSMPVTGGLTDSLLYALIVGMVGVIFSYFWQIVLHNPMRGMLSEMQSGAGQNVFQGAGLALFAFFSPFLVIIGLFVWAGVLHLCLLLVSGARSGFEATFRVVSYGYSANVFMIIPFCGGILWFVWIIILNVIGLREAHETTGGKAAVAVFLPAILCCGLALVAAAFFLSAAALSFGTFVHMQR